MANAIKPEDLAKVIANTLEEYQGLIYADLEQVTKEVAKETVKELKQTSPKKTGDYAKSWTHSKKSTQKACEYAQVIHVKAPHYRLTHLLEFSHEKVLWGRRTGEMTDPTKTAHIKKAEEKAVDKYEKRLLQEINL